MIEQALILQCDIANAVVLLQSMGEATFDSSNLVKPNVLGFKPQVPNPKPSVLRPKSQVISQMSYALSHKFQALNQMSYTKSHKS